ncbi:hypothetical protein WN51_12024 [Melipona quadrifasciata]|uniref:Uncharacterized protein n=1 Tax=Melipona quadrifasciata TaxID=166423 RepID=A0A0M9A288_9HYME|nr:hypothetical protein WN51_12024 [Melipona quadrifasciata]
MNELLLFQTFQFFSGHPILPATDKLRLEQLMTKLILKKFRSINVHSNYVFLLILESPMTLIQRKETVRIENIIPIGSIMTHRMEHAASTMDMFHDEYIHNYQSRSFKL